MLPFLCVTPVQHKTLLSFHHFNSNFHSRHVSSSQPRCLLRWFYLLILIFHIYICTSGYVAQQKSANSLPPSLERYNQHRPCRDADIIRLSSLFLWSVLPSSGNNYHLPSSRYRRVLKVFQAISMIISLIGRITCWWVDICEAPGLVLVTVLLCEWVMTHSIILWSCVIFLIFCVISSNIPFIRHNGSWNCLKAMWINCSGLHSLQSSTLF